MIQSRSINNDPKLLIKDLRSNAPNMISAFSKLTPVLQSISKVRASNQKCIWAWLISKAEHHPCRCSFCNIRFRERQVITTSYNLATAGYKSLFPLHWICIQSGAGWDLEVLPRHCAWDFTDHCSGWIENLKIAYCKPVTSDKSMLNRW